MKREIKFRGKMVHYDGWVFGNLLLSEDGGASIWPIESNKMSDVKEVGNGTVGQYTGLKDKNGKEIYEGDILKGGIFLSYKVEWDYEDCGWNITRYGVTAFEVIGNIYENHELL